MGCRCESLPDGRRKHAIAKMEHIAEFIVVGHIEHMLCARDLIAHPNVHPKIESTPQFNLF